MLSQSGPMQGAVHLFAIHQGNTVRSPVVSPPIVSSFAPPPSAHRASLPMWPSSRLLWPSSRSVRTSGISGPAGLRFGDSCGTGLSGSWWEGDNQHACARVGLGTWSEHHRRATPRSCCGWLESVPGSSVGHRHHIGVGSPRRWHVQLWMMREHVRKAPIPSSLARVPGPSWSSWLQKSADVGLRRRHSSLVRWRRPKHGQRQRLCKSRWGRRTLGGTVGEGCWLAPRRKLSQVRCSSTALLSLLQVTSRLCTM